MAENVVQDAERIVGSASYALEPISGEFNFTGKGYEATLIVEKGHLIVTPLVDTRAA